MSIEKFSKEISKTGFVLENRIALELKKAAWTVISNKYYEDDFEGSVREIDLLAYKCTKVQHFVVYTVLLISCKKSESNAWALLAREINPKDPNSDWWPMHAWSNDKVLSYELSQPGLPVIYHNDLVKLGVSEVLAMPGVEVFAFQEMSLKNGSPQNDKNIFNALTSLMKAQAYELSALPQRKKDPTAYQFNLISVIDTDLIRLNFKDENIKAEPIDSEHYIARYIIKKRETFSRIRFIRAPHFSSALVDYDRLHAANCRWFDRTYDSFYERVVKDYDRAQIFIEDLRRMLKWPFNWEILRAKYKVEHDINSLNLYWEPNKGFLEIQLGVDEETIELLNGDDMAKKIVANVLKKIYRYAGEFKFAQDIPF